jgi:hypothetical protein
MPEEIQVKPPKNYPLRGAVILGVAHLLFIVIILLWGFERSIFMSSGGNFILYFFELPGAELARALGQTESLDVMAPYAVAFFVNTIFYVLLGFALGYLFLKLDWIDESHNVFLTDDELEWKKWEEQNQ